MVSICGPERGENRETRLEVAIYGKQIRMSREKKFVDTSINARISTVFTPSHEYLVESVLDHLVDCYDVDLFSYDCDLLQWRSYDDSCNIHPLDHLFLLWIDRLGTIVHE